MANKTLTASYEGLSKIVKIILQIFFGGLIGGIYRIIRFTETGNVIFAKSGSSVWNLNRQ